MKLSPVYVGVDVSMDTIDVYDPSTLQSSVVSMIGSDLKRFADQMVQQGSIVVFEATGGYDHPLAMALSEVGAAYVRVNPGRARSFARSFSSGAKTDKVDARMLSKMGQALELSADAPMNQKRQELSALVTRRNQLVDARKRERTQIRQASNASIKASHDKMIDLLSDEIAAFDRAIAELIAQSPEASRLDKRLQTVPGFGPVCAATLIASLPELGHVDRRAIASLTGLAPIARDSGQRKGARSIAGGRRDVRRILYLAAQQAVKLIPHMTALRNRLTATGRTPKQALIAVARRIIVIANAMIRDAKDFEYAST